MSDKKMRFCVLCGKNRNIGEFKKIALAKNINGEFIELEVCQSCQTVFHNLRRIIRERMAEVSEPKRIIVPGNAQSGLIIRPR